MRALTGKLHFQTHFAITSRLTYASLTNYKVYMYTSILHTKRLLYCNRHSFSSWESLASSDWQATSANTYHIRFCVWHFGHTSSTSQNHWQLRHYHTPNDSLLPSMLIPHEKHQKSYNLQTTILCLHHCLVNCVQVHAPYLTILAFISLKSIYPQRLIETGVCSSGSIYFFILGAHVLTPGSRARTKRRKHEGAAKRQCCERPSCL